MMKYSDYFLSDAMFVEVSKLIILPIVEVTSNRSIQYLHHKNCTEYIVCLACGTIKSIHVARVNIKCKHVVCRCACQEQVTQYAELERTSATLSCPPM